MVQFKYAFQITEKIAFGLIKLSIVFLWRRIFGHIRAFNIGSWVLIVILAAWSLAFFFATIFQCAPHEDYNWAPLTVFLTDCSNTFDMVTVFAASDILTDLIIIIIPIPIVSAIFGTSVSKIINYV